MKNREYFEQIEKLFRSIEEKLDELEDEIDYDRTPDKLEATFEKSGKKFVINTQRAIKEVWLAGNSRGWHFQYNKDKSIWYAKAEKKEFYKCLCELLSLHLKREIKFY